MSQSIDMSCAEIIAECRAMARSEADDKREEIARLREQLAKTSEAEQRQKIKNKILRLKSEIEDSKKPRRDNNEDDDERDNNEDDDERAMARRVKQTADANRQALASLQHASAQSAPMFDVNNYHTGALARSMLNSYRENISALRAGEHDIADRPTSSGLPIGETEQLTDSARKLMLHKQRNVWEGERGVTVPGDARISSPWPEDENEARALAMLPKSALIRAGLLPGPSVMGQLVEGGTAADDRTFGLVK